MANLCFIPAFFGELKKSQVFLGRVRRELAQYMFGLGQPEP